MNKKVLKAFKHGTAPIAAELFSKPDIDGGFVGGASMKADFGKIVNYK